MAPIFPLAKLAFLFVKQVARPLSTSIRRRAIRSAFFKEYVCLPPARLYHWCEVRMKMYVMNLGRSGQGSTIPKLNEEAAIELGANLLGEGVIFGIAVSILAFEVSRQKEKEKTKEDMEQEFINSLENRVNDLTFATEELDTKLRELTRLVYAVQHEAKQRKAETSETSKEVSSQVYTCKESPNEHTTVTMSDTELKNIEKNGKSNCGSITRALMDAQSKIINERIP